MGLIAVDAALRNGRDCRDLQELKVWTRTSYLGGQGDLVSGLIMGITGFTIWVIGVIKLLTKSP